MEFDKESIKRIQIARNDLGWAPKWDITESGAVEGFLREGMARAKNERPIMCRIRQLIDANVGRSRVVISIKL
jgi:hypothetical protein